MKHEKKLLRAIYDALPRCDGYLSHDSLRALDPCEDLAVARWLVDGLTYFCDRHKPESKSGRHDRLPYADALDAYEAAKRGDA